MALDTNVSAWQYEGNDVATSFAFTDLVLLDADLLVTLTVDVTEVDVVQTIVTHYTVTGAGVEAGGTVNMVRAPASGETLTIERIVALTQLTVLRNATTYFPNVVEDALDKLTMGVQQGDRLASRAVRVSTVDDEANSYDLILPKPVADEYLQWNADASAIIGTTVIDSSSFTVTAWAKANLLDETTATAILVNLEARVAPLYSLDAILTFDAAHFGYVHHKNSTTSRVWSVDGTETTVVPGTVFLVVNEGAGNIVLTRINSAVLSWFDGGTVTDVDVTVAQGGVATLYKKANGEYWVWGIGLSS